MQLPCFRKLFLKRYIFMLAFSNLCLFGGKWFLVLTCICRPLQEFFLQWKVVLKYCKLTSFWQTNSYLVTSHTTSEFTNKGSGYKDVQIQDLNLYLSSISIYFFRISQSMHKSTACLSAAQSYLRTDQHSVTNFSIQNVYNLWY